MLKRFLYGGPLIGVGAIWCTSLGYGGTSFVTYVFLALLGALCLIGGVVLFTFWKKAPTLATLAWWVVMLILPVGSVLQGLASGGYGFVMAPVYFVVGLVAIQGLRRWHEPAGPRAIPEGADAISVLLAGLFKEEFGGHSSRDGTPLSLRMNLQTPPGQIAQFLENLRLDYGLPVSSADVSVIDDLPALQALVSERRQPPAA